MLPFINKLNLRSKLYVYLIPVIATTCLAISYFFYSDLKQSLSEEKESSTKELSYQAQTKADNYLVVSQSDADFVASTNSVKNLLSSAGIRTGITNQRKITESFSQLQITKPQYREIYIFNNFNELITYHSNDIFYDPNKDLDWLTTFVNETKTKGKALPKFLLRKTNSSERLSVLSPVYNSGKTIGFVVLTQDFREFTSISFELSLNKGEKVVYTFNDGVLHELSEIDALLMKRRKLSNEEVVLKNKHWISHSRKTMFGDVVIFKDTTNFHLKLSELKHHIIIITTFIIFVFLVLIWWIVDKVFIKPLKIVGDAANQISKGTYKTNSLPTNKDEIGGLSSSINLMAISLRENTNQVSKLAYEDDLTELPNKKAFLKSISRKRVRSQPELLTVWVLNLRSFKQINDIHGFQAGDDVLKDISRRLIEVTRQFSKRHQLTPGCISVYKSSADEFLFEAYLESGDSIPRALSKTIISQIELPILIDGRVFSVSGNVGWSQSENQYDGLSNYQNANMAMHEGKKTLEQVTKFKVAMVEQVKSNQAMSDNIKRALDIDEFELYYQPKCNINNRNGANEFEALIRWFSPEGFISPGIFIPFAEDANLISYIDFWVTERVIKDVALFESLGHQDFTFSFNISGQRISDPKFIQVLKDNIEKYKINPSHLQVEITEHSLIHDLESSIESIKRLKELSISVALDDFGTGHSSLGYIQTLPLETLKIDRCFIQDVDKSKRKENLLKHIIAIGRDMELQMVAEGVETEEELEVLKKLNCDLVQGYLFFKPMPLADAEKLVIKL